MLFHPTSEDFPVASERLFDRKGPQVLEVGFGDGRFLVQLAQAHPDWNLLGVEVSLPSVTRAYKRLHREGVAHARLYKGHARFLVRDVLAPHSLDRIYVNFPDPWPNRKHADNRLLQADFFRLASTRLSDGGALLLTTDHETYFHFAKAQARETSLFQVDEGPPPPGMLRTKYALKWQEQERDIYHAVFTKTAEAAPSESALVRSPMQHVLLDGDLSTVGPFNKLIHEIPGGHVVIIEAYRLLDGDGLLFLGLVEEPDLRQDIMIKAWQTRAGVLLTLQRFGHPINTRGLSRAVLAVADWLETQGLRVLKTWV